VVTNCYLKLGMREMLNIHKKLIQKLEELEKKYSGHDDQLMLIFEYLDQLEKTKQKQIEQSDRKPLGYKITGKK